MQCPIHNDKIEILLDYSAQKLDQDTLALFERHLMECAECRTFAKSQTSVWEALDSWEAPVVSEDFDRRLYKRIEEHENSSWWKKLGSMEIFQPFGWKPAVPLLTACATLAVALFVYAPVEKPSLEPNGQPRIESVDLEQAETVLDDMEMLKQLAPPPAAHHQL